MMRNWVETNRCAPLAYRYDQGEDAVVVSVDFIDPQQANEFARHFGA
jgi:hypothetical protein